VDAAITLTNTISGVFFEQCTLSPQCVNFVDAQNIALVGGVLSIEHMETNELLVVDDVNYVDCQVEPITDNGFDSTILMAVMPIAFDAVSSTGVNRAIIKKIRISGGTWSVPAGVGSDFVPFFLQCWEPIVENVTFLGGGVQVNSFAAGPGYRGNGYYTDSQKCALRQLAIQVESATTNHAQYWATIAGSGGGLEYGGVLSAAPGITSAMIVKNLRFFRFNRKAGWSGVIGLVCPNGYGNVDVDGILIQPSAGTTGNTQTVNSWIGVFHGHGVTAPTAAGAIGVIRNLQFSPMDWEYPPAVGDVWAVNAILLIQPEGRLDFEGIYLKPTREAASQDGPGSFGAAAIRFRWPWGGANFALQYGPVYLADIVIMNFTCGILAGSGVFATADLPPSPTVPIGPIYVRKLFFRGVQTNATVKHAVDMQLTDPTYSWASLGFYDSNVKLTHNNGVVQTGVFNFASASWKPSAPCVLRNNYIVLDYGANAAGAGSYGTSIRSSNASSVPCWDLLGNYWEWFQGGSSIAARVQLQNGAGVALTTNTKFGGGAGRWTNAMTGHSIASTDQYLFANTFDFVHNFGNFITP
jgi:hypothetical protein